MEINVHDDAKYVSIWLTRDEAANSELREKLKPLYAEYKQRKYRVVVFESGRGDLAILTQDLLKHNLDVSAHKDTNVQRV